MITHKGTGVLCNRTVEPSPCVFVQNIEKQQLQVRSSGNNPSSIMQSVAVKSLSDLLNIVK